MRDLLAYAKRAGTTSTWIPLVAMVMSGVLDSARGENVWKVYVLYAIISVSKEMMNVIQTYSLCKVTSGTEEKGDTK